MSEPSAKPSFWNSWVGSVTRVSLAVAFGLAIGVKFKDEIRDYVHNDVLYDPVAPSLNCQKFNDVAALNKLPAAQREAAARAYLAKNDTGKPAPTPQNVCTNLAMIDALHYKGLDGTDGKLIQATLAGWAAEDSQIYFARGFIPDIEKISQILADDPVIQAALDREQKNPQASGKGPPAMSQDDLQHISDVIRAHYGLPPIGIYYVTFLPDDFLGVTLEAFRIGDVVKARAIVINENQAGNFYGLLNTIAHETRHSIDVDWVHMLTHGKMAPDDPRALYTAIIAVNTRNYISATNDVSGYILQPIENYAYVFGDWTSASTIEKALKSPARRPQPLKPPQAPTAPAPVS